MAALISFIASTILIFCGIKAKMSTDKLFDQILSRHPELSRKDILERLENEKRKMGGLISEEILLRMIAADLGIENQDGILSAPSLSIKDLIPSLNNITVVGRVVAVFSPRAFEGKRSGKIASLFITDKSGVLRVVLWNDKSSLIESGKIKTGQVARFCHGYTREDHYGNVELHLGERSEIEINPQSANAKDYPAISRFATKIKEVTEAHKSQRVNVVGVVREVFAASVFNRQDSSAGRVMRLVLADETGEIPVVVWNEKVDELENVLKKEIRLQIVNAKIKKATGRGAEIHVDAGTYVEQGVPKEEFMKIDGLKEGLNRVSVKGEVVSKPMLREVKTLRGELVKLASFELKDETGKIWVSAWREQVDFVKDLKTGDRIIIKNAYVKKGFDEQLEISTRNATSIILLRENGD
jgi:replication factor A1